MECVQRRRSLSSWSRQCCSKKLKSVDVESVGMLCKLGKGARSPVTHYQYNVQDARARIDMPACDDLLCRVLRSRNCAVAGKRLSQQQVQRKVRAGQRQPRQRPRAPQGAQRGARAKTGAAAPHPHTLQRPAPRRRPLIRIRI